MREGRTLWKKFDGYKKFDKVTFLIIEKRLSAQKPQQKRTAIN